MNLCILTAQEYKIFTSFRFLFGDFEAHKSSEDALDFLPVSRVLFSFPAQKDVFDLSDDNTGSFNLLMQGDVFDLLAIATVSFSFPTQENAFDLLNSLMNINTTLLNLLKWILKKPVFNRHPAQVLRVFA